MIKKIKEVCNKNKLSNNSDLIQEDERKKLKTETYKILDWQKKNQENQADKEKEFINYEAKKLKNQWDLDLKNEQIEKEKLKEVNKNVYLEIEEFNKKELNEKQKKLEDERLKDKELINCIIKRERVLDEIDKREKVKIKKNLISKINFFRKKKN